MGVIVVVDEGVETALEFTESGSEVIEIVQASPAVVVGEQQPSQVIEVLAGLPGVQNVFVGPTPPANPEENWIWIQT